MERMIVIKEVFEKLGINDYHFFDDEFVEYKGVVYDNENNPFEVEGDFNLTDNELSYSILFYDINNDIEYDGMIGRIIDFNSKDTENKIMDLIIPNFVFV